MINRSRVPENFRSLLKSRSAMGPLTCMALIELWVERKLELNHEEFDLIMDQLHDALEDIYNERYRLLPVRTSTGSTLRDAGEDEDTDVG